MAMTYTEAMHPVDAAEKAGRKALAPFTYRCMPSSMYLKELIDQGCLARPYHRNLRYFANYGRSPQYVWRFDPGEFGACAIGELGTHWLYLADWYYGAIRAITAMVGHQVRRGPRPGGRLNRPTTRP